MADKMHPIIAIFEQGDEVIDATGRQVQPEDAITKLAGWIGLAQDRLTENDMAVLAEIGAILYRDGLNRRMEEQDDNNRLDRLLSLASSTQEWLCIDREELKKRVVAQVLAEYRALPSPEPIEGVETGLDFLGLLLTEGGDNGLYESSMEQLDGEIYSAVASLDDNEQMVLLLPIESGDLDDLFADRDIDEWPRLLRAGIEWSEVMRELVLSHVDPKSRQ